MRLTVNVKKKHFFGILLIGLVVIGIVGVVAYNAGGTGGNSAVFGHSFDELEFPSGAVMYFNLTACPQGWSVISEAVGRYIVGVNSSMTIGGVKGTALLNLEDRPVGQHTHAITDPAHSHTISNIAGAGGSYAVTSGPNFAFDTRTSDGSFTRISINNAGSVAGTNAPYIQFLVCRKN